MGNPNFEYANMDTQTLLATKDAVGVADRGEYLLDLPNTETEVKSISNALNRYQNNVFLGKNATEANFKQNAGDYGIIHLATHFLSDDTQPLYSRIALSQADNDNEDGYLQTYEIFNLDLNADLVVLSACNTGSGKHQRGEGVLSLARALR